ncbi:hypothetical protein QGN32_15670 [Mycolicibacterium sp. ND9-15]|nr:hypothetical protein [Mycolicibacterium sp. ND9-15]WSE58838.1 hypothetical protein QGN32_15670 [Mycolicibacterium sp. ND9-15]
MKKRSSNDDALLDNRLAFVDQALFAAQRATGRKEVIQCVWVYEHPIDFDGVRRFQHNLSHGLLGRRIERSPLPFARNRWVSDRTPPDVNIAECARPRAELSDWADECAQLPIDPERGPGWRLDFLPMTDGSTAVSLVVSHYLIDGIGLAIALADAIMGNKRGLDYPPPNSRGRLQAVVQDARRTARDAPEVARALGVAARQARRRWNGDAEPPASRPVAPGGSDDRGGSEDVIVVPTITVYIDLQEWDARAAALGGAPHTLVSGLAAKLGERIGRRRAGDGLVTLQLPMNERVDGDTRANAMAFARASVDPARVTTDLRGVRAAINQALKTMRETPDESLQFLWLTHFMPKRALKRLSDALSDDPDQPIFCSNLGDLGSVLCRLDGTDAEYVTARVVRQHVTRQWLDRTGGQMIVQSWRIRDKVMTTVAAYQPGAENTRAALGELAASTLAEFGLAGEIS